MDIKISLDIRIEESDIIFDIEIENNSPYIVEEVWCPSIGGLREAKGEPVLKTMSMHMWAGANFTPLGDGFPQACGYWGVDYPTLIKTYPDFNNQTPFVVLQNGLQGMYLGVHDDEINIVNFVHELKPGYLSSTNRKIPEGDWIGGKPCGFVVSAVRLPFIGSGERKKLAPAIISLFKGTWHEGLKPYLNWRKTWYKQQYQPDWVFKTDCWMTLHINSPEGCARYKYTKLPDIMAEAKEKGVQVLQLIGWARDGQDGAEPYQDIDPRLGTKDELKSAIQKIREMGIFVLIMCKFKWADQSVPEYKAELERNSLKDYYGNPVQFNGYAYQTMLQQINGGTRRCGAGMCHLSKEYREMALRELKKIFSLEPDGILYDELSNNMLICFDESHGHKAGESNYKGSMVMAKEFFDAARKHNPDFVLAGEGTNDPISEYYPINYIRSWDDAWQGEGQHIPAWKYMNPDMAIASCIIGWDDKELINQCLTYGYAINYEPYNFKGRISDFPDTVEYGQKVLALRAKLKEYIWYGKFMHTCGAEVSCLENDNNYIYSVFENKKNGKKAVVVSNQNHDKKLKIEVKLDNDKGDFLSYGVDGSEKISEGIIDVPARSATVLVEK